MTDENKCIPNEDAIRIVRTIKNSSDEEGVKIIVSIIDASINKTIKYTAEQISKHRS